MVDNLLMSNSFLSFSPPPRNSSFRLSEIVQRYNRTKIDITSIVANIKFIPFEERIAEEKSIGKSVFELFSMLRVAGHLLSASNRGTR